MKINRISHIKSLVFSFRGQKVQHFAIYIWQKRPYCQNHIKMGLTYINFPVFLFSNICTRCVKPLILHHKYLICFSRLVFK